MSTKLIVGLGNPGTKYQWTRHNAGFMVLDRLSQVSGIPVTKKRYSGYYGEGSWKNERIFLLKPQTFMNLSGQSVSEAMRFHKLDIRDLLVIHDDLDIPYGKVKLKEGGGHAGHNGLRSLSSELGSGNFVRVRFGIGRPEFGDAADYVLSNFSKDELAILPQIVDGIIDLLCLYLREGIGKAMSLFNNKDFTLDVN